MNDGKSFFALAKTLAAQQTDKAAQRSAVSRAYYGAFNYGRHVLRQLGYARAAAGRSHGDVWNRFQNCGDAAVESAGRMLADLEAARVSADYHLDKPNCENPKNVQFNLAAAQSILNEFDACLTPARRIAVAEGIGRYEKAVRGAAAP
jgi:hypothetical protein